MIIGEKIKQAINKANVEVNQVAIALEMSPQNLYKIFKKDSCETKYLEKLSELTNTPLKYFFSENWDAGVNQTADRGSANFNNSSGNSNSGNIELDRCLEKVKHLEERIKDKDERLKDKEEMIEALKKK